MNSLKQLCDAYLMALVLYDGYKAENTDYESRTMWLISHSNFFLFEILYSQHVLLWK
jgi:hypothetical protein